MKPSEATIESLDEIKDASKIKLAAGANTQQRATKFEFDLQMAHLAIGASAARIALNLLRFRGACRCIVIFADSQVSEEEEAEWREEPQRAKKWSPRLPMTRALVEAWLWDVGDGRVFDAHSGWRAVARRSPIPDLSADELERALRHV
jgi:hypothetical protein